MQVNPKQKFYMAATDDRVDGKIDLSTFPPDAFEKLDDAIEYLKEQADEHGCSGYVFACEPIIRVKFSQRITVTKIKP